MEYCPNIKNDEIMPFTATWLDLEIIILILSEVSQSEKDKYDMTLLICGILKKKKIEVNLFTKQK